MDYAAYLPLLLAAVHRHLSDSEAAQHASKHNWWRPREAALLALGSISEAVFER